MPQNALTVKLPPHSIILLTKPTALPGTSVIPEASWISMFALQPAGVAKVIALLITQPSFTLG